MKEHIQDILVGGRPMTKLEQANKEIERLQEELDKTRLSELNKEYIINELEKELDRGYRDLFEHELVNGRELITNIKNYIKELKGDSSNE